jgi:AcrR family transcriptional regulator
VLVEANFDYSLLRRRCSIPPAERFRERKQPKQNRATVTRQRILDAAARVFAVHGYSAGTTNRIAEAAELSIGSLYQYFPNKDAILRALMDAHVDDGARRLAERLGDGLPPRLDDALRLFVRAMIDNHRDNPRLHWVLFDEAPRAPEFLARLQEMEQLSVEMTVRLLDEHPEVRTVHRLHAQIVVATIESLVHRLIAARDPVDLDMAEDEIVKLLVEYLRAPDL